jgi:4-amino-4-deoxy-L-arabinose transferase-like glycosyltransferase
MSLPLPRITNPFLIFLLITVLSLILRLSLISQGPYHVDCLSIAMKSQDTWETGRLSYALGFGYPLVVMMGAFFIGIFKTFGSHDPVFAVNFMSVFFGSLAVGMIYLLARRLFDPRTAFFSAVLFCFSPIFLATSVYGMNHIPAVCFLLASLYFLVGYLKDGRASGFIWSCFFLACMGASRIQDMVLMIPAISVLFWAHGGYARAKKLFLYLAATAAALTLLHIPYLSASHAAGYTSQLHDYWSQGLIKNFRGLITPYLARNIGHMYSNFSLLGLILLFMGVIGLFQKERKTAIFLGVWVLVPFLFLGNLFMSLPRFFIVLIPALVLYQGFALARYDRRGTKWRWLTGAILIALVILQLNAVLPGLKYRHRHSTIVDYAHSIAQATEPDAAIMAGDESAFIFYYAKRDILAGPHCLFGCSQESLEAFRTVLDRELKAGRPVYITDIGLYAANPQGEFHRFLNSGYDLQLVGNYLYEDWHHDCFHLLVWPSSLYRVNGKDQP